MQELKQKIINLLTRFAQQELGNRLSEFSMMSLRLLIVKEFDDMLAKEQEKEQSEDEDKSVEM